ncbi:hypothetical protein K438DRAFT_1764879 [Mycena galopus ATCC 62051]|nr:hypothetical protein K438DRAFT_1764879 [Mycena galopus ATCC 62051]
MNKYRRGNHGLRRDRNLSCVTLPLNRLNIGLEPEHIESWFNTYAGQLGRERVETTENRRRVLNASVRSRDREKFNRTSYTWGTHLEPARPHWRRRVNLTVREQCRGIKYRTESAVLKRILRRDSPPRSSSFPGARKGGRRCGDILLWVLSVKDPWFKCKRKRARTGMDRNDAGLSKQRLRTKCQLWYFAGGLNLAGDRRLCGSLLCCSFGMRLVSVVADGVQRNPDKQGDRDAKDDWSSRGRRNWVVEGTLNRTALICSARKTRRWNGSDGLTSCCALISYCSETREVLRMELSFEEQPNLQLQS